MFRTTSSVDRDGHVIWHESAVEFADYANYEMNRSGAAIKNYVKAGYSKWRGGTFATAMKAARDGDVGLVDQAEKILDEIDASIDTRGLVRAWAHEPVGAFPDVPAFLGGTPENMWTLAPSRGPRGSVKIIVALSSSGGFDVEQLRKRNAAILACALAVQRVRPVEVWAVSTMGTYDEFGSVEQQAIKLESPIVLSNAAAVLGVTAIDRILMHGTAAAVNGFDGNWAHWYYSGSGKREETEVKARQVFHMGDDDLWIPPIHIVESQELTNPVAWINGILDKYRGS